MAQMQPGSTATGNVCFQVKPADIPNSLLLAEPQFTVDKAKDSNYTNNPVTNTGGSGLASLLTGYINSAARGFLLEPITMVAITPQVFAVNHEVPVKSLKELIALAKAKPLCSFRPFPR